MACRIEIDEEDGWKIKVESGCDDSALLKEEITWLLYRLTGNIPNVSHVKGRKKV